MPLRARLSTGTPRTGTVVWAAIMPGRWAAPPAPATITSSPRPSASFAYEAIRSGVRWAETTRRSCGTPKRSRVSAAWRIVSQSEALPITTPTRGSGISVSSIVLPGSLGPVYAPSRANPLRRGKDVTWLKIGWEGDAGGPWYVSVRDGPCRRLHREPDGGTRQVGVGCRAEPGSEAELRQFARLQERLRPLARKLAADPRAPQTVVVVPSLSLDAEELAKISGVHHYEERLLCMLMLLRRPQTNVVFVTSQHGGDGRSSTTTCTCCPAYPCATPAAGSPSSPATTPPTCRLRRRSWTGPA